ncbi:MAG: hypothetical protein NZZ41_08065, partial [Candidatus Dojkabacteria bacterium]|nr:hypothetical protein [Candidatus Dojkabacteria bacterium]
MSYQQLSNLEARREKLYKDYDKIISESLEKEDRSKLVNNILELLKILSQEILLEKQKLSGHEEELKKVEEKQVEKERELKKKEEQPEKIPENVSKMIEKTQIINREHSTLSKLGDYVWIVKIKLESFDNFLMEMMEKTMPKEHIHAYINYFDLMDTHKDQIFKILKNHIINDIKIKFPIQIQVCFKYLLTKIIVDPKTNKEIRQENIVSVRTDDISNLTYTANDIAKVKDVFYLELETLLEKVGSEPMMYDNEPDELLSLVIRFWEYRPPFLIARGYVETPEFLEKRKVIINIQNKDNQCFLKCIYRAINYDKKNRNNTRDVSKKDLEEFKKKINCSAINEDA